MLTIPAPCPRCNQQRTIHTARFDATAHGRLNSVVDHEVLVRCGHCLQHSIAIVMAIGHAPLTEAAYSGDINSQPAIHLVGWVPEMPNHEAPAHVPATVATAYIDGLHILADGRWTPAAASFRTALDRATKLLWRQTEGNDQWLKELSGRIKALKAKLDLPQAVTDWAHQVRIVGNEMHDLEEVSEDDARDVASFTELFLTYTFTLPQRVEEFRHRRGAAATVQPAPGAAAAAAAPADPP